MRELATRLSFLVIPWVMLSSGARWSEAALVSAAQVAGYLAMFAKHRLGALADIASIAVLGAMAYWLDNTLAVGILAAMLGALRGVRSERFEPSRSDSVQRAGLILSLLALAGLAAGAAVVWLGSLGALWVNALGFAVAAARQIWSRPPPAPIPQEGQIEPFVGTVEPQAAGSVEPQTPAPSADAGPDSVRDIGPALALSLLATVALSQAAAVLLMTVWVRDVTRAPELLGLMAAGLAIGLLGTGTRQMVFGLGVLAGGGILFVLGDRPPALLLVVAVAFVAGVALASITPVIDAPLARLASLGVPLGTLAAAWASAQTSSVLIGLALAAGLYVIALLVPIFAFRHWRQLLPEAPLLPTGPGRLPGRLTVTLVYTNGQWVVEVRRGRGLLGSRHLVKSAEALNMLALLEVPGVRESVERALEADQAEATRQAERMRTELSELEAKLAGLNEMAEISDTRKSANA